MPGRKKSKESEIRKSPRKLATDDQTSTIDKRKRKASQSPVARTSKSPTKAKTPEKKPNSKKGKGKFSEVKLILSPEKSPRKKSSREVALEKEEAEEETDISENQEEASLFGIIKQKRGATVLVVKEWVKRYKQDRGKGASELVNLVVSSSGSTGRVELPSEEVDEETIQNILVDLMSDKEFKKFGGDYPFTSKKKEFRRFELHYLEFWDKLVSHISSNILFDDFFIDTIRTWLTALSGSSARSFRHVSTMTGLQLIKSVVGVTVEMRKNLDVRQRQLETAQKKKKVDEEAVNQLEVQTEELQERVNQLEDLIRDLFNGIFVIRYRDAFERIRAECVKALGEWVLSYPLMFLAGNYVKYIGWLLSDRAPEVRLNAIKALKSIYKKSDFIAQMDQFSERFSSRISSMCFDIDPDVAKQAISVSTIFAKNDLLKNDDIRKIFTLISDDNSTIRDAAAEFITELKFNDGTGVKQKKGKVAVTIRQLLDFITEHTEHAKFPNYIVDALWTRMPLLKDWAALTDALFQEGPKELSESHQIILIRLLVASVRKFTGEVICPKRPKEYDYKETEVEDNKKTVTSHLMPVLPDLLEKFKNNDKELEELVQLPKYLLLESYQIEHQEAKFSELLQLLLDVYLRHSSEPLLLNCAGAFQYLLATNYWGKPQAKVIFNQLVEKLSNTLSTELKKEDIDDVVLEICLNRIAQLFIQINITKTFDFYDPISDILGSLSTDLEKQFSEKAIVYAITIMTQYLLWAATSLSESTDDHEFLEKRRSFFKILQDAVSNTSTNVPEAIRESAFYKACDLIVVFTSVQYHRYHPNTELLSSIVNYFEEQMEEVQPEPESIDRREVLITSFARLVVAEPSEQFYQRYAPSLLIHLDIHSKRIDEILKVALKTIREREKANEWEIILETLKKRYRICKEKYNRADDPQDSEDEIEENSEANKGPFKDLKDLALRLYYSYGIKIPASQRNCPASIVTEGIEFALPETGLNQEIPFLYALIPFTSKLFEFAHASVDLFQKRSAKVGSSNLSKEELKAFEDFKSNLQRAVGKDSTASNKRKLDVVTAKNAEISIDSEENEALLESVEDDESEDIQPSKEKVKKSKAKLKAKAKSRAKRRSEESDEGETTDDSDQEKRRNSPRSPKQSQEPPTKPKRRKYPTDESSQQQSSQEEPSARRTRSLTRGR